VDYCSGAFLMTRRALFQGGGGFEEAFSPGYYEDPDYGARLWQAGWRFVYLPEVEVLHYENGTSARVCDVNRLLARNRRLFVDKHAHWVAARPCATEVPPLIARTSHDLFFRVLLLTPGASVPGPGRVPPAELAAVAALLQALDAFLTVGVTGPSGGGPEPQAGAWAANVEQVRLPDGDALAAFLEARGGYYDLAVLAPEDETLRLALCSARVPCAVWHQGRFLPQPAAASLPRGPNRAA
jgi:hypothetical protein